MDGDGDTDTLSEPDLVRVSDKIDHCVELAQKDKAELGPLVGRISDLLIEWDDINQPVQVYEQHQGHEEGRSKRIYEKLRSLSLELHNDRGKTSEARQLTEALLRTFPELESVAEVLKNDVAQLETLDEQQKQQQLVEPLMAACHVAKNFLLEINTELSRNGFSQNAKFPVAGIYSAFKSAVSSLVDVSIAFVIVRDLALQVNNDHNDPQTAFKLIDALLVFEGARPTEDLIEKLEEERAVLYRNWKMKELEQNKGNTLAMSRIVGEMLRYARGSDRAELLQLKSKLDQMQPRFRGVPQQAAKRDQRDHSIGQNVGTALANLVLAFKRIITWSLYAAVVVFLGWILIEAATDEPANRSTYQPSAPRVATPTQAPSTAPTVAVETMPPIGQGLTFDRYQIRYCVFQGQRLEAIRALTNTNYQIDRFNGLIDDFNARCSNYRYRSGDLSSVQREASDKAPDLRADARRIVSSW